MLEGVVTDGTARFSKLEGYRAAGKTGTAQKALEGKKGYAASKYVASFAGYAPASNPKFVIVVVVDEPKGKYYGAEVAAPVFKKIAEQILGAKAIAPDIPNYAPQYSAAPGKKKTKSKASPLPAPDFQEFKVLDAALTHSGAASNEFQVGDVVVPDFSRLSLRDAALEAGKAGLGTESAGSGRVVAQFPPPGSRVSPGARVRLRLK
jgi:cell division protein FtsI (penicillin-binding protein 3)